MKNSVVYLSILLIGSIFFYCSGESKKLNTDPSLDGFWEGNLPLGKQYILVLYLNSSDNEVRSFIQLFNSGVRESDDEIESVDLIDELFQFEIKSVNGLYKFQKDADTLKGTLSFPNGDEAKVKFIKVVKPSVGDFSEIISREKIDLMSYKYSTSDLIEDFDFFIKSIETNQPNLFLYVSKENFKKLISDTREKLSQSFTQMEFLRILTSLTEKIGCDHLGVGPSTEISKYIDRVRFLPFFIKIVDDKVYISENYIINILPQPGLEILSVNGKSMTNIVKEIIDGLPVDGRNLSSKINIIEQNFAMLYINHIETADHYKLEYRIPATGEINKVEFEGLKFGNFPSEYYQKHPEKVPNSFPITSKFIHKQTALIKVTQFYYKNFDKYYQFIDSVFADVNNQNISNLIIDLRGNAGGDPRLSFYLLSKIARNNFVYFKSPKDLAEVYPNMFVEQKVNKNNFNGRVFILIDGACKSTTGHFIALAKHHKWAELIGRETGSTFYCNAGEKDFTLPNTKIKLIQPTKEVITDIKGWNKVSPLKPDYEVKYTYEDLINNNDPDLEKALKLVDSTL